MAVAFPRNLQIRVDHELRAALVRAAATEGASVSDLARRRLRASLGLPDELAHTRPGPIADLAAALHRAGEPSREIGRRVSLLTARLHGDQR